MLNIFTTRGPANVLLSAQVVSDAEAETLRKEGEGLERRRDWKTFDDAKEIAAMLGEGYIATDAGRNVSPRYDVQELPKVGDKVSYSFNGDSYPCGVIKSISPSLKLITTDKGDKFYRVRETGCWRKDGTWSLIPGWIEEQNPSF